MRIPAIACLAFALLAAPFTRAAQTPDPVLVSGLQAIESNGVDAGLRAWYADRPALATEMKTDLQPLLTKLGPVLDTEVVAIQQISKRVTRYYVAIYFTRCPLWLRVERYANGEKSFFFPLRFSTNPDEILPGYLTEFQP